MRDEPAHVSALEGRDGSIVATLNTQQKAPVEIKDFHGEVEPASGATITLDPPAGVVTSALVGNFDAARFWLTAVAPGSCTVTVAKGGSTGTLVVDVEAAPLTLALGDPQPK
jgi:hypothetical protein